MEWRVLLPYLIKVCKSTNMGDCFETQFEGTIWLSGEMQVPRRPVHKPSQNATTSLSHYTGVSQG